MAASPETMEKWKPITAADLIQYFKRFRDIRKMYAELEENRYGEAWSALETSDGGKGDIGEAALNELRRRNRYPMKGSLDNPDADPVRQREKLRADTEHEVVDLIWSTVRMADIMGADAEAICLEAAGEEPFIGTPRRAMNRYALAAGALDELIDPPTELMFNHDPTMTKEQSANLYLKREFQATVSLVNSYEMNLGAAVRISMDQIEVNIPGEHIPQQT